MSKTVQAKESDRAAPAYRILPAGSLGRYRYAVICTRYRGLWVLSRHRERDTFEMQGGHIEANETPLACAERELFEESGIRDATLYPVCDYEVYDSPKAGGAVFLAVAEALGELPESEMAEVRCFRELPPRLTYPILSRLLYAEAEGVLRALTEK